jgi:hypothetical protein
MTDGLHHPARSPRTEGLYALFWPPNLLIRVKTQAGGEGEAGKEEKMKDGVKIQAGIQGRQKSKSWEQEGTKSLHDFIYNVRPCNLDFKV